MPILFALYRVIWNIPAYVEKVKAVFIPLADALMETSGAEEVLKELAKSVIGTRPLSELDDYFAEMDKLGAAEYVQYYADYYASMH